MLRGSVEQDTEALDGILAGLLCSLFNTIVGNASNACLISDILLGPPFSDPGRFQVLIRQ
jgi:hypothetical protein